MTAIEKFLDKYAKDIIGIEPNHLNRMMVFTFMMPTMRRTSRKKLRHRNPILANGSSK